MARSGDEPEGEPLHLGLFIRADLEAQRNLAADLVRSIRERAPAARIDVIDVARDPEEAERAHVLATPTLTRWSPTPSRAVVGAPEGRGADLDAALGLMGVPGVRVARPRQKPGDLAALLAVLDDAVLVLSEDGLVLYANPGAEAMLGADLLGAPFGLPVDAEPAIVTVGDPDAPIRARMTTATVTWEGRDAVSVILRDVTPEEALRASEERYALAVRGSGVGIWTYDVATGRATFADEFAAILGERSGEDIGGSIDNWLRRVHPDDLHRVDSALRAQRLGATERLEVEHRVVRSDGSTRWVVARGALARDESGAPARIAGSLTDVTGQHNAHAALRVARERYRIVTEHATDVVIALDHTGTIRVMSPAADRLIGPGARRLEGRKLFEFVHVDDVDGLLEAEQAAVRERAVPVEFRLLLDEGRSTRLVGVLKRIEQRRAADPHEVILIVRPEEA